MLAEGENRVDVWFTGKQAKEFGLFDESYDLLEKAALIDNKTDFKQLGYELPTQIKEKYGINVKTNKSDMEIKDVTASMLQSGNKEAYDAIFNAGKKAEQERVSEIMEYGKYDIEKANELVKSGNELSKKDVAYFIEKKVNSQKVENLETESVEAIDPIKTAKNVVTKVQTAEEKEKEAAFDEVNEMLGLPKLVK